MYLIDFSRKVVIYVHVLKFLPSQIAKEIFS